MSESGWRTATAADAEACAAIYAPYVETTVISFEVDPPDAAEMRHRIEATLPHYPWLVWQRDGTVLGYAYAGAHRTRAAYRWSVDTAIYLRQDIRGQGIGRQLYTALLQRLAAQGYVNAYAGVTLPNAASVGLHEALGYTPVGVYRQVGYKLGRWHDVGWWQRELNPHATAPAEPRPPFA